MAGEEEGYDGGGIPIKPTERPQTKERDEFLLLLLLLLLTTTSKKNSFQLQMAAFWRGKKTHKKVNRNCSMCASVCTAPYIICIPIYLWFKKRSWKSRASTCRAMEDGDCFVVVCVCDTLTRLHVVLRSQQNKTTVHSLPSFVFLATLIRFALLMPFFSTLPLLPPPPPPTFIFFFPFGKQPVVFSPLSALFVIAD